jgi:hypothetical protein
MRSTGIGLILLTLLYYAFMNFSPIYRWSNERPDYLSFRFRDVSNRLERIDREMTVPEEGQEGLDRLRSEKMWISLELDRRQIGIGFWMPAVGLGGLALLLLSFVRIPKRDRTRKRQERSVPEFAAEVYEAPAREVYSDDWEFTRQREGGFLSRDEAVAWILKDPLKKCDYCGGEMKPASSGQREGIELVTFYKKVPVGAKDLRVVLGSFWFVKAASELTCVGCERTVRR